MKYGVLNQKNKAYRPDLWKKLEDLYVGGFDILARAAEYIPQQVGEPPERYKERLALASYINYLGMIVDAYASNLFAQEPVVGPTEDEALEPFWSEFASDADLRGSSLAQVLREAFGTAILKKRAIVGCDFPQIPQELTPKNRAQEEAAGVGRAYAFEVCLEELLDWEYSSITVREVVLKDGKKLRFAVGTLKWAILKRQIQRRETPEDARDTFVEEFKIWRLVDGQATWQTFRTDPRKPGESPPNDELDLTPFLDGGPTSFKQIPLIEICVPDGLWLGNKLGPIALEMFRRRSALHASESRHLFPTPVVKLGSEVGAVGGDLPSERQQNPNRGNESLDPVRRMGGLILGKDDDFKYVAPPSDVYEIVDKQIADTVDEFYRVASMMAASISNTTSALGRSGKSKEQDHSALTTVLEAFGVLVKDFAVRIYDVITEARSEDITWKVHGLDKFDVIDRAAILDEAKSLSLVPIRSRTFQVTWQTKVALALVGNVAPDVQAKIQKEVEQGVVAEEAMNELMLGGMHDEAIDGARAGDRSGERPFPSRTEDGAEPSPH